MKDLFKEPGPQHLWGHSRAHTSAQILGQSGPLGMSLILGLTAKLLIGGWGPQQRLGQVRSHLVKQILGQLSMKSLNRLQQTGFGHVCWQVCGLEQTGARHETDLGTTTFGVGVTEIGKQEWQFTKGHDKCVTWAFRDVTKWWISMGSKSQPMY